MVEPTMGKISNNLKEFTKMNDDCSALCPICGHHVKLATLREGYNHEIHTISVYCGSASCTWNEDWKLEKGGYKKTVVFHDCVPNGDTITKDFWKGKMEMFKDT